MRNEAQDETRNRLWEAWYNGLSCEEIARTCGGTTDGVCARVAHIIVTEFGGWQFVTSEKRLRQWANQIAVRVRRALNAGIQEIEIARANNITHQVLAAVRVGTKNGRRNTRGPSIRGRKLAMILACYTAGLGFTKAGRLCDLRISAIRSVYGRIMVGRELDYDGWEYRYSREHNTLIEVKE